MKYLFQVYILALILNISINMSLHANEIEDNDLINKQPKHSKKVVDMSNQLSPEEVSTILEPYAESDASESVKFELTSPDKSELVTYILHAPQKRTCWQVRAKHEYQAYVVRAGGNQWENVDKFELFIKRSKDHADYKYVCLNTNWCPKTDIVSVPYSSCGTSFFRACATKWGRRVCTGTSVIR